MERMVGSVDLVEKKNSFVWSDQLEILKCSESGLAMISSDIAPIDRIILVYF